MKYLLSMVEVLRPQLERQGRRGGQNKLSVEDQLLMTKAERQHNRALAQLRVRVEHVIRRFKIFRIFSRRYRNRRKRFGLRLNLIAGLLNYELAHAH